MASPIVVKTPEQARAACDAARARGERVGLVPTMGALHEGHLALVREALRHANFVMCTIFVNPTQFGPNEDFARYPRDLDGDVRKLEGASVVFAPDAPSMYPRGEETRVSVGRLAQHLCGPHRPGHFEGVATVVAKLFGVTGPCTAVFGKKDYQQLAILRRVATDLFMPVTVVGHPIVREADGLALSSRNAYLVPDERARALSLSRGLSAAARAFAGGERRAGALRSLVLAEVEPAATSIDYVTVADADALVPFPDGDGVGERAVVAIACRIGTTRLIDNLVLGEDPAIGASRG
ncbi:MAG TPA: pantoate--beta-alanine ligase [Labilithrix sp.]|nr:pantoate--beta-alanine ligase [Labilithrix sp.]